MVGVARGVTGDAEGETVTIPSPTKPVERASSSRKVIPVRIILIPLSEVVLMVRSFFSVTLVLASTLAAAACSAIAAAPSGPIYRISVSGTT